METNLTVPIAYSSPVIITWQNIIEAKTTYTHLKLYRTDEGEKKYVEFKKKLLNENKTVDSYVHENLLGYSGTTEYPCYFFNEYSHENKTYRFFIQYTLEQLNETKWLQDLKLSSKQVDDPHTFKNRNNVMLIKNNFRYNLSYDIDLWVFWYSGQMSVDFIYSIAKRLLPSNRIILHENPRQSVPGTRHYQLFIKK